ncbi:hypothetical protein GF371_00680 [Candidatus Woesearchaeota archaeon]|nr:hypothetical protein [Candidatus Woesearchaeota archaeon]
MKMPRKPRKWATVKPGGLYGWKKTQSDATRHRILSKAVNKDSYATIIRRMNQLRNITKDKKTKQLMEKDMEYLKKKYRK